MNEVEMHPTEIQVSRHFLRTKNDVSENEDSSETISVRPFLVNPARVSIEYGMTLNLGNYESARVAVTVSVPCYVEEIDDAGDFARKKAEARVLQEARAIRETVQQDLGI